MNKEKSGWQLMIKDFEKQIGGLHLTIEKATFAIKECLADEARFEESDPVAAKIQRDWAGFYRERKDILKGVLSTAQENLRKARVGINPYQQEDK